MGRFPTGGFWGLRQKKRIHISAISLWAPKGGIGGGCYFRKVTELEKFSKIFCKNDPWHVAGLSGV